jgi:hypothetical protein
MQMGAGIALIALSIGFARFALSKRFIRWLLLHNPDAAIDVTRAFSVALLAGAIVFSFFLGCIVIACGGWL